MTKGEQTRQRLVAEAAGLFNRQGYEGSSMQDIMQATGLQKGGIYPHLEPKRSWHRRHLITPGAKPSKPGSRIWIGHQLRRPVKQFIANFVEVRSPVPGGCPLLNTAIEVDDGNAVLRKRAVLALRGWRNRLAAIVQKGIDRHEIAKTTQPDTVATIVIASLEGALMMSRLERNGDHLLTVQKHLNTYLESSVRV